MQPSVQSWLSPTCSLPWQHRKVKNSSLTLMNSRGTRRGRNLPPDPYFPFDSMGLEQVITWLPPTHGQSAWGPCHGLELYKSSFLWGIERHVLRASREAGELLVLSLTDAAFIFWFVEGEECSCSQCFVCLFGWLGFFTYVCNTYTCLGYTSWCPRN